MSVFSFVAKWLYGGRPEGAPAREPARARPALEVLEDRSSPSHFGMGGTMPMMSMPHGRHHAHRAAPTRFQQTNLVSDQAGVAQSLDPLLTNAWGISAAPAAGAFWVSANGTGLSPLYVGDVNGSAIQQLFKVTIPGGSPTGQVLNINQPIMGTGNSTDVSVTDGTNTGASVFIFASTTQRTASQTRIRASP